MYFTLKAMAMAPCKGTSRIGCCKEGTFWYGTYQMVQMGPSGSEPYEPQSGGSIPVASMVENILGCKWSVRLLQLCAEGHKRPSALLRACPGLSAKVMNERLRKMVRFGILERRVLGEKPPVEVEYGMTPFGLRFMRIIDEVRQLQEDLDRGKS